MDLFGYLLERNPLALFVIERGSPLPAARAWELLTDWRRHGRVAPLTAVRVRGGPPGGGLGTVFVARTRVGRLGFDDPMEVTEWQPPRGDTPGVCRLDKRGRVFTGWALVEVLPLAAGCRVRWTEDISLRGLPRAADPLTRRLAALVFGKAVDRLLVEDAR